MVDTEGEAPVAVVESGGRHQGRGSHGTVPRPWRIVVVDDDPETAGVVAAAMGPTAEVRGVSDAYRALAEVDAAEVPDLLVLEVFLPGADGVELLRRLRDRGVDVPAVVVTHSERAARVALGPGVRAVVRKPARPVELRAVLATVLPAAPPD